MRLVTQAVDFSWQSPHPNQIEGDLWMSVRTGIRAAQAQDSDAVRGIGRYVTQRRS